MRLELWDSAQRALHSITETLMCVDEVKFLTGCRDSAKACRRLRRHGPSLAVGTLGASGG